MENDIRDLLKQHGRLAEPIDSLSRQASLYDAGMTSHATVNVMLGLENHFDVEFPDAMLKRNVFESIEAIENAIQQLTAPQRAAV